MTGRPGPGRGVAACLAVLFLAILRPVAADESIVPRGFAAGTVDVLRGSYTVELKDGVLLYRAPPDDRVVRISPTRQRWREFRRALDDIDVWQWRSEYRRNITDGDRWWLRIEYSGRSVRTGGYAGYPGEPAGGGTCSLTSTKPFTRFRAAVQGLLGERPFGDHVTPVELFDLAELQLVATHLSPKPGDRWAMFRDPTGKVHRVWQYVSGCCERDRQRLTYVGPNHALLREVTRNAVSLEEICTDAGGDFIERVTVLKKAGAP